MTAVVWLLLGAANVAGLIRAYRPQFCRMLREEFFTPSSRAGRGHPFTPARALIPDALRTRRVDGSNTTEPAFGPALLGALPPPPTVQAHPSTPARSAPTSAASPTPHPVTRQALGAHR